MSAAPAVVTIDLTAEACPATWVRAMWALDDVPPGGLLELRLERGDSLRRIPGNVKADGHRVTSVRPHVDGTFTLSIEKARRGLPAPE